MHWSLVHLRGCPSGEKHEAKKVTEIELNHTQFPPNCVWFSSISVTFFASFFFSDGSTSFIYWLSLCTLLFLSVLLASNVIVVVTHSLQAFVPEPRSEEQEQEEEVPRHPADPLEPPRLHAHPTRRLAPGKIYRSHECQRNEISNLDDLSNSWPSLCAPVVPVPVPSTYNVDLWARSDSIETMLSWG